MCGHREGGKVVAWIGRNGIAMLGLTPPGVEELASGKPLHSAGSSVLSADLGGGVERWPGGNKREGMYAELTLTHCVGTAETNIVKQLYSNKMD